MLRRVFAKRAGVIVDICRHHGTWLDSGELQQLIAFVQRGGLDRAAAETNFESSALRPPARPEPALPDARQSSIGRNTTTTTNFYEEVVDVLQKLFA